MRRFHASLSLRLPHRFGALLALAALLLQMLVPAAAALAMGSDPLGSVPICTSASHAAERQADAASHGPHKALHALCPLCHAQVAGWSFPPPAPPVVAVLRTAADAVWLHETTAVRRAIATGRQATGPPVAA